MSRVARPRQKISGEEGVGKKPSFKMSPGLYKKLSQFVPYQHQGRENEYEACSLMNAIFTLIRIKDMTCADLYNLRFQEFGKAFTKQDAVFSEKWDELVDQVVTARRYAITAICGSPVIFTDEEDFQNRLREKVSSDDIRMDRFLFALYNMQDFISEELLA